MTKITTPLKEIDDQLPTTGDDFVDQMGRVVDEKILLLSSNILMHGISWLQILKKSNPDTLRSVFWIILECATNKAKNDFEQWMAYSEESEEIKDVETVPTE